LIRYEATAIEHPTLPRDPTAATLFLDYDGTLHSGHALLDADGTVTLESGGPLFEFAPLLVEMLEPYPAVEIVLTTSWLQAMPTEKVVSYLPPELAQRVVDTTRGRIARFSHMKDGSGRTDIIAGYAYGKRLENWLAIDDSVYGAYYFGREPGELVKNFVLLDSTRGISDERAQQRIREWLVDVHKNRNSQSP
jgi:HAD domain in Swiss Army Knife RNA repair proteins